MDSVWPAPVAELSGTGWPPPGPRGPPLPPPGPPNPPRPPPPGPPPGPPPPPNPGAFGAGADVPSKPGPPPNPPPGGEPGPESGADPDCNPWLKLPDTRNASLLLAAAVELDCAGDEPISLWICASRLFPLCPPPARASPSIRFTIGDSANCKVKSTSFAVPAEKTASLAAASKPNILTSILHAPSLRAGNEYRPAASVAVANWRPACAAVTAAPGIGWFADRTMPVCAHGGAAHTTKARVA